MTRIWLQEFTDAVAIRVAPASVAGFWPSIFAKG